MQLNLETMKSEKIKKEIIQTNINISNSIVIICGNENNEHNNISKLQRYI